MKVLMFGWEFPPISSGGLGTACYGLTKALSRKGTDITFVLPYSSDQINADFAKFVSSSKIKIPERELKYNNRQKKESVNTTKISRVFRRIILKKIRTILL